MRIGSIPWRAKLWWMRNRCRLLGHRGPGKGLPSCRFYTCTRCQCTQENRCWRCGGPYDEISPCGLCKLCLRTLGDRMMYDVLNAGSEVTYVKDDDKP